MAIIQISKIQQRSGNLVDLPQLDEAQFGWASDAKRLFIGKTTPNENIEVLTSYSNISFSQIDGSDGGNFNIANATNGQVLTYVDTTNTWENWPSTDILTANANFKLDLGDVGNIKMDGGATGYILETDGVGNVAWTSKGTLRTTVNNLIPTVVTGSISTSTVTAGSFVVGRAYTITTVGTTNFTLIGASANTIGITFIATGVGTGDGDATLTTLTVTGVTSGALTLDMSISGTGVSANTYIAALGSGTGGNGTYYVNVSQTVVSGTINGSLVMTVAVTTPYTNGLAVTISGANADNANTIVNGQTFYVKVAGDFPTSGNATLYTSQNLATANAVVGTTLGTYTANSGIATALISGSGVSNAGGSVNTIQFNNSGVLDGSANFTIAGGNLVTLNGNFNASNIAGGNLVTANFVTGTLTTAAQPNITSTGTLAGLVVAGNITPSANITYNLGNNTNRFNDLYLANSTIYIGAQTISANTSSVIVSGNLVANIVGNVSGNTTTAGTVTTAAQPNITSTGTLASLSVSGNANIGNIGTGGLITATGNISGANINGTFYGAGTGLTSIPGSNVSGTVANATYSITAGTALSVSAGNISGTVNLANFATTSNAVAGANVTGTVANATFATTADSATTAGTVTTNAQPNITSIGTLTSISVSGNTNTGNLITGGAVSASGNASVLGIKTDNYYYANGVAISFDGAYSNSNVAAYLPTFTGVVGATTLTTGANTTLGNITGNWQLTAGSSLNATYADLAEYYEADAIYLPGTVLAFGGNKEVTIAEDGTNKVAGVVSTDPAYVMNMKCKGEHIVALALQGRVPTKVRGTIHKGDMMVSGGNGFAKPSSAPHMGTVIGKALENFDGIEGVIEVAIGRL